MKVNPKLYGKNDETGIVAVNLIDSEKRGDPSFVRIYKRTEAGALYDYEDRLHPFIFLSDRTLLQGVKRTLYRAKTLNGGNYYNYLVVFDSWGDMWNAVKKIKENAFDRNLTDSPDEYPIQLYMIKTPTEQYLTQTGKTLFVGMEFNDVTRLRLDIETYSSRNGFPNAERDGDFIMIITLATNKGYKATLYLKRPDVDNKLVPNGIAYKDETAMLEGLVGIIQELDPDTIEGHNIFSFDLPYIKTRCEKLGVPFDIGRNQDVPDTYESSKKFAERNITYTVFQITGRHVIDTFFETMNYDVFARDLPGYGLKVVSKYFGFAPKDRTYVEGDKISWYWDNNPLELLKYAEDDTTECGLLSEHLGGSSFFLTQMLPMSYQKSALAGTSTKIESLLVREYLNQYYSLPSREVARQEVGGYTDIFKTGVYDRIIYADVESLYPSIMLKYAVQPEGDDLGLFREFLQALKDLRLEAKRAMNVAYKAGDKQLAQSLNAKQSSYKILINSFYGQLGFSGSLFNDFSEADRVTVIGQQLLRQIIKLITSDGGSVVEVDTDGVLAQAAPFVYTKDDDEDMARAITFCEQNGGTPIDDEKYVKSLTERMPPGINIDFDGRAVKMVSYKKKNYALKEPDKDSIKVKGGSLVSRMYEPFGKAFVKSVVESLMDKDVERIAKLYRELHRRIVEHDWDVSEFSKKVTLKDAVETYKKKIKLGSGKGGRNRDAGYELALRQAEETGIKPEPGDRIVYYVAGTNKAYKVRSFEDSKLSATWSKDNPDENTNWYLRRLKEFSEKFEKFFSEESFKFIFSTTEIPANIDWSQFTIENKLVHRVRIPIVMTGPKDLSDLFWVDRALAGARFLKTLDTDDFGVSIGKIITTFDDELIQQWAIENEVELEVMKANPKLGAAAPTELAERMLNAAGESTEAIASITIHDGYTPIADEVARKAATLGIRTHISRIV
jgi:DNA polymerase elongation subunit (family B)